MASVSLGFGIPMFGISNFSVLGSNVLRSNDLTPMSPAPTSAASELPALFWLMGSGAEVTGLLDVGEGNWGFDFPAGIVWPSFAEVA